MGAGDNKAFVNFFVVKDIIVSTSELNVVHGKDVIDAVTIVNRADLRMRAGFTSCLLGHKGLIQAPAAEDSFAFSQPTIFGVGVVGYNALAFGSLGTGDVMEELESISGNLPLLTPLIVIVKDGQAVASNPSSIRERTKHPHSIPK
mmetsp:Transcript_106311/g.307709  ORF Transcript_106311/g.307709 Transcript_106311/m.307709 type:complete len:146 (-) Transcript_106311:53-490(-)